MFHSLPFVTGIFQDKLQEAQCNTKYEQILRIIQADCFPLIILFPSHSFVKQFVFIKDYFIFIFIGPEIFPSKAGFHLIHVLLETGFTVTGTFLW